MFAGLRVTTHGLKNFHQRGYSYIWTNLAFVMFSLPLITLPAAFSALMRIGHLAHTDPGEADLTTFWETFKQNFGGAFAWGVGNVIFALINFNNVIAYARMDNLLVAGLEAIWISAAVIWVGMLLFTWPIYYEMADPTIMGAMRNALVMVLLNPWFTITILTLIIVIGVISTVLVASWLLLTFGALAAIANAAVLDRLDRFRQQMN